MLCSLCLAILAIVVAVLLSCSAVSALLSSSLTASDRSRIQLDLERQLPFEDAASLYAYSHTLTLLSTPIPDVSVIISTLRPSLSSSDVSEVHDAVASLLLLHQKPTLPDSQLSVLSTALKSPNLLIIYHAASTLLLLHHASSLSLSSYPFASALTTLQALEELDHTYRVSTKADEGNLYNTALAYDLLAAGAEAGLDGWKAAASAALQSTSAVMAADKAYGLPSEVTEAEAVGQLMAAAVRLASAVKAALPLTAAEVEAAAEYLLANRFAADVEEVHAVVHGLHAVASLPSPLSPLCLSVTDHANLKAQLTNVLSAPVKGDVAASIRNADGQTLQSSQWQSAEPGAYDVSYTVNGASLSLPVHRTGRVSALSASVTVTDSGKEKEGEGSGSVTHPASWPHPITADSSKYLVVRISVDSAVTPSQVVTLLTRASSNASSSTAFPARKLAESRGQYATRINLGSLEVLEALGGGGSFTVHVLVGDALLEESIDWLLADVELALPRLVSSAAAQQQADVTPIVHTFRPADHKTSYLLPLIFTLALAAAFAVLLLSLLRVASIEFPSSPVELSSAMLFQSCLALLIALYVLYWLRLNIFQALTGSLLLAVPLVLTGNKALTLLHIRKAKLKQL